MNFWKARRAAVLDGKKVKMTQEDKDLLLLRLHYQRDTDNLHQAVNIIIEILTEVISNIKVQQGESK